MDPWLARLRHDLVKRAIWPARDLGEILEGKTAPSPRDLQALRDGLFGLQDEDGSPCDARFLLARLSKSAPRGLRRDALESFAAGVDSAMNVVDHVVPAVKNAAASAVSRAILRDAIEAVLALEKLFDLLAQE